MTTRDPLPDPDGRLAEALGRKPFPWQRRLLREVLGGPPPRALDLPTGLGKTSVMAIWLVARACGATHLPRRLVYVVDRRAVVDQSTREAERLRMWAERRDVSAALGLDGPLPISTLRGQFADNRTWMEDPSAPGIVVGTVDMVGSRLLFEGYGSSRKIRPYQAGLLGADALFVLDEAHLVPPFERLLEAASDAAELQPRAMHRAVIPRSLVLSLSATGRDHGERTFRLDDADLDDEIVRLRLQATKRIHFGPLPANAKLADILADKAWELAKNEPTPVRVLVFCNRRDDAERVKSGLDKRIKSAKARDAEPQTELFVGARRVWERSDAEARLNTLGFLAGSERPPASAFLIATSAGEVGVDLDADHLVADVVAWERVVQRLGRVNRRGERDACVHLFAAPDAPLGEPVSELLLALPPLAGDARSGSPEALAELTRRLPDTVRAASTPEPLYPALTRPHLDAWSMTSLREHTGRPEVQPWLRGWIDGDPPTCTVAWRTRLGPPDATDAVLAQLLEAAPPHAYEGLEAECFRVAEWLAARAERLSDHPDDALVGVLFDEPGAPIERVVLGELGDKADDKKRIAARLPGRTLVVNAWVAGLKDGLLSDDTDEPPPTADTAPHAGAVPVPFRIASRGPSDGPPDGWSERLRVPSIIRDEEIVEWWVVEKRGVDGETEDDRSTASHPQLLDEHQRWTADAAAAMAARLALPADLSRAIVLAARLHDEGKRAPRWQRAFRAPAEGTYAKTRGPIQVHLLDGYRHEFGSLSHAEVNDDVLALPDDLRDLVLHLVASHHGLARPSIGTGGCDDGPPSALEARARAVARRFVALQERWGPWGLAWLETLVRAADQQASRKNDARGGK